MINAADFINNEDIIKIAENNFVNKDIITGDFRLIDLFSKPFNFKEQFVTERIYDYPNGYPIKREMILIEKKYVPTELLLH